MLLRFLRSGGQYGRLLLTEVLVRSLRGSVLIMGALTLLSSTSLWMFISSSFAGHDILRAASYAKPPTTDVVLVGIDPTGYSSFFGGRSPLNRQHLVELFHAIDQGASQAHTIVVDLDLTPIPGESSDPLDAFFQTSKADRWLLADPNLADTLHRSPEHQQWLSRWCAAGLRFAYPYLPTSFGQVQASHQFKGAFADQSLITNFDCATRVSQHAQLPRVDGQVQLQRMASPMSAAFMRDGMVLPFQGDVMLLKSMLESMQPKVVVVGGMWGNEDVFLTPFGERHGAHLHAAAIAGKLAHMRIAPLWVQLLAAWVSVALISQVLALIYQPLYKALMPWANEHPGHQFLLRRVWPLLMVVLTLCCLLLISEAGAWLMAHTGWWIPTAAVAATVVGALLFVWNWGLNEMVLMTDSSKALQTVVVKPIQKDWQAMKAAGLLLLQGSSQSMQAACAAEVESAAKSTHSKMAAMNRPRAMVEWCMAFTSLCTQTVLPLLTFILAITRPL